MAEDDLAELDESTLVDANLEGADGEIDEKPVEEVDAEMEELKRKVREMEEETIKLSELQKQAEQAMSSTPMNVNKEEVDARSIHVGNVDYGATPEELQAHFQSCGTINRVTILCNKFTGAPKGFAYVEFVDKDAVANAMVMNESLFRGRQIKVTPKRTNLPAYLRGSFRGSFRPYRGPRGGRGFSRRPRRPYFHPYM